MKISKKTQYGLRAMTQLAKAFPKGKAFPLKNIAKKENIPFDFLEKIIAELEKAGLVKGKKGPLGGYFLAKAPDKIKVGVVVRALETTMIPVSCMGCAMAKGCMTKGLWKEMQNSVDATLDSTTLLDLINN